MLGMFFLKKILTSCHLITISDMLLNSRLVGGAMRHLYLFVSLMSSTALITGTAQSSTAVLPSHDSLLAQSYPIQRGYSKLNVGKSSKTLGDFDASDLMKSLEKALFQALQQHNISVQQMAAHSVKQLPQSHFTTGLSRSSFQRPSLNVSQIKQTASSQSNALKNQATTPSSVPTPPPLPQITPKNGALLGKKTQKKMIRPWENDLHRELLKRVNITPALELELPKTPSKQSGPRENQPKVTKKSAFIKPAGMGDLMAQIRGGKKLRKADTSISKQALPLEKDFMEVLKSRLNGDLNLRKVEKTADTKKKRSFQELQDELSVLENKLKSEKVLLQKQILKARILDVKELIMSEKEIEKQTVQASLAAKRVLTTQKASDNHKLKRVSLTSQQKEKQAKVKIRLANTEVDSAGDRQRQHNIIAGRADRLDKLSELDKKGLDALKAGFLFEKKILEEEAKEKDAKNETVSKDLRKDLPHEESDVEPKISYEYDSNGLLIPPPLPTKNEKFVDTSSKKTGTIKESTKTPADKSALLSSIRDGFSLRRTKTNSSLAVKDSNDQEDEKPVNIDLGLYSFTLNNKFFDTAPVYENDTIDFESDSSDWDDWDSDDDDDNSLGPIMVTQKGGQDSKSAPNSFSKGPVPALIVVKPTKMKKEEPEEKIEEIKKPRVNHSRYAQKSKEPANVGSLLKQITVGTTLKKVAPEEINIRRKEEDDLTKALGSRRNLMGMDNDDFDDY